MTLKLQRGQLTPLCSWLNELNLQGSVSRNRTRFVALLIPEIEDTEKNRQEIVKSYAVKNEDGTAKVVKNEVTGVDNFDIPQEGFVKVQLELNDLLSEFVSIDVLDGNKQKIKDVRDILLNTDYKFGPKEGDSEQEKNAKIRQMNDYEVWCTAFELLDLR